MRRERSAATAVLVLLVALALLSGTAHGKVLPRCQAQGYGLMETPVVRSITSKGTALISAGWLTGSEGHRACELRTTVGMTIRGAGGVVVARARWRVHTVLQPWSAATHTWAWRNWCAKNGAPRVALSDASGKRVSQLVPHPPACTNAHAGTAVATLGDGTRHVPRPGDPIPPRILTTDEPPPFPPALLTAQNGMIAGDGYTLVAVYAGSPGNDDTSGRLVVLRQNELFGVTYLPPDIIDLRNVGPLEITTLPAGGPTSAQRGTVGFVAGNGTQGVLDLKTDTVHFKTTARGLM